MSLTILRYLLSFIFIYVFVDFWESGILCFICISLHKPTWGGSFLYLWRIQKTFRKTFIYPVQKRTWTNEKLVSSTLILRFLLFISLIMLFCCCSVFSYLPSGEKFIHCTKNNLISYFSASDIPPFFFFFVDRLLIGLLLCHVICRHWHIYLLKYHLYPLSFPHQTHKRYKSFQSCHQIPRWLGPRKNSLSVSWETATLLRLWGHWSSSIPRRGGRKETTVVWQGSQMKVSSVTWNGRLAPKTLRDEGGGPMALQLLPPRWEVGSRSWVGLSLQG